jgi:hypothetical protein
MSLRSIFADGWFAFACSMSARHAWFAIILASNLIRAARRAMRAGAWAAAARGAGCSLDAVGINDRIDGETEAMIWSSE